MKLKSLFVTLIALLCAAQFTRLTKSASSPRSPTSPTLRDKSAAIMSKSSALATGIKTRMAFR